MTREQPSPTDRSTDDGGPEERHPWADFTSAGTARGLWILRRGRAHCWLPRTALDPEQGRALQDLLGRQGLFRPCGRRRPRRPAANA